MKLLSPAEKSNQVSTAKPSTPVKPRGGAGMRGGLGSFGSGGGMRGSVRGDTMLLLKRVCTRCLMEQ
jgi:hypothetical protein